jgi:hypothetical protein
MIDESAACDGNPTPGALGPARCYEPVIGTLVAVTDDHEPVVEFGGPEGKARRRTAISTVKIEGGAVGHLVELGFVRGDLDRPVITKLAPSLDWQPQLQVRWDALGRKVLGLESGTHEIATLVEEFRVLACVTVWFEARGNITRAAKSRDTSRRSLRYYVNLWKAQNPGLVPRRPVKERKVKPRKSRAKARQPKVEGHAPAPDGGSERGDGSMADG